MTEKFGVVRLVTLLVLGILFLLGSFAMISADPGTAPEFPVKDMVTMVDFGAAFCQPCKAMAPFLEKLEKEYKGRAAIVFVDMVKSPELVERFGIKEIPTQIFYNKQGKEASRHIGFMSEEAIRGRLKKMGVK